MVKAKDVESYRENGYLLVENVFDAATLARMRKVIADLVAKAAGVKTHNDIYDLEPTHTPEYPRVRRIKTPHKVDPFFLEIVKQPGMISILKALLGKEDASDPINNTLQCTTFSIGDDRTSRCLCLHNGDAKILLRGADKATCLTE